MNRVRGADPQWMPNVAALSESLRTYALDNLFDYGRSTNTKEMKRPDDLVNWLDGLFSALELEETYHLMGLS